MAFTKLGLTILENKHASVLRFRSISVAFSKKKNFSNLFSLKFLAAHNLKGNCNCQHFLPACVHDLISLKELFCFLVEQPETRIRLSCWESCKLRAQTQGHQSLSNSTLMRFFPFLPLPSNIENTGTRNIFFNTYKYILPFSPAYRGRTSDRPD